MLMFVCHRHSLFGGHSLKMIDADLSRLYTATSLMQIDDNIMRCVLVNCSSSMFLMLLVILFCQCLESEKYKIFLSFLSNPSKG